MAGVACPRCGTVNAPGSWACWRCGVSLPQVVGGVPQAPGYAAPPPPPPPPGWAPPSAWGYAPPRPALTPAIDGRALDRGQVAAIIGFVAGLVSPVVLLLVGPSIGSSFSLAGNGGGTVPTPSLAFWSLVGAIGVGLAILTWLVMRSAFTLLRPGDPEFGTPSKLVAVGVIGLVLLAVALPVVLAGIGPLVQCVDQNHNQTVPMTNDCLASNGGELVGGILLLFVSAIISLIGYIGLILGVWRLGTRYDVTVLHIGAIVAIFLPFIGWLLVWIGIREARRKVPPSPVVPLGTPKL